jgi:hypothetical protein
MFKSRRSWAAAQSGDPHYQLDVEIGAHRAQRATRRQDEVVQLLHIERFLRSGGKRTSVIQLGDGPESLLPRCIPYLQPHDRGRVDVHHPFRQEGRANSRLCIWGREGVLDVAVDERGLADALAAQDDDFCFEAVRHGSFAGAVRRSGLGTARERAGRACWCRWSGRRPGGDQCSRTRSGCRRPLVFGSDKRWVGTNRRTRCMACRECRFQQAK